ncbi:hypothetical protein HOW07_14140 [Plantibacter sp. MCCC 1A11337]|uniref:hypothetical protein n=1 Tax=Plantibacter sp. MCCC 1A11337 TaxID=2736644 RepID=UPI0015835CD8|nr:hypothetical protein [Plantibacter sp. MCCC 1A11337]NUJ89149.1 hypothetical protein [Plantibacter sp. MCCC 1A11337]
MRNNRTKSIEDSSRKNRPRFLSPVRILLGLCVFLALAIFALLLVPRFLLDSWLADLPALDASTLRLAIGNAAQVVLFGLGGIIALVGVGLSLSRHSLELMNAEDEQAKELRRIAELEQQRRADNERELRARFVQAVGLLSNEDKGTTRQAGVYALGALADDWMNHGRADERRVCIDVLCGYLRSRWDPAAEAADDERRVRSAGFGLIAQHLRGSADPHSWQGESFNLVGSIVDFDVNFSEICLESGSIDLSGANLSGGELRFDSAHLAGGSLKFNRASLSGANLRFSRTAFSGTIVSARYMTFTGGIFALLSPQFTGGSINFTGSKFSGGSFRLSQPVLEANSISFQGASFSGGRVRFVALDRPPQRSISFAYAEIEGSDFKFDRGEIIEDSLDLTDTVLASGRMNFARVKLEADYEYWLTQALIFAGGALVVDDKVYKTRLSEE